jgi:hypothetical protein
MAGLWVLGGIDHVKRQVLPDHPAQAFSVCRPAL